MPAARVQVAVVGPDDTVHARLVTMTGSDGLALFRYSLADSADTGVFTVRMTDVSHADQEDALYDAAANSRSSTRFSVNTAVRRGLRDAVDRR